MPNMHEHIFVPVVIKCRILSKTTNNSVMSDRSITKAETASYTTHNQNSHKL